MPGSKIKTEIRLGRKLQQHNFEAKLEVRVNFLGGCFILHVCRDSTAFCRRGCLFSVLTNSQYQEGSKIAWRWLDA